MKRGQGWLVAIMGLTMALSGCTAEDRASDEIGTVEEGGTCSSVSNCVPGLDCIEKVCAPFVETDEVAVSPRGKECSVDADCGTFTNTEGETKEFFCGRQDRCIPNQLGSLGETCGLTIDCEAPLVCNGVCGICTGTEDDPTTDLDDCASVTAMPGITDASFQGAKDLGASCDYPLACRRPLVCGLDKTCQKLPDFASAACALSGDEKGAFRVYFETGVAGQDTETTEFYRLPSPSDLRKSSGLDFTGHGGPGDVLGMNFQNDYLGPAGDSVSGFALNVPVFFRLSDYVTTESICLDETKDSYPEYVEPIGGAVFEREGDEAPDAVVEEASFCSEQGTPNIFVVNLATGERLPIQLQITRSKGQYICGNWLGIGPQDGMTYEPGAKYAAVILKSIRDIRGDEPIQDADFKDWVEGKQAIPELEPLRDWVDAEPELSLSDLAGATVFTTGTPSLSGQKMIEAVADLPQPTFNDDAVICDTGVVSPCDDGLGEGNALHFRKCSQALPIYHQIHGTYQNPVWQVGERPYRVSSEGGTIEYGADGLPLEQSAESMCYSLAVPVGQAMPADGWPTVVYAHGTGGFFSSMFLDGTAARLTQLGYAVLSFDNVMHGPRSGLPAEEAAFDAGQSFFNLANPAASRDNVLQGAADVSYALRLVANAAPSVGGLPNLKFDQDKLVYFGHSQGTVIGGPVLAFEHDYGTPLMGVVWSGSGAELALSILNKTEPIDIKQVAAIVFGDNNLSRLHPMMSILGQIFGPSDAISYAGALPDDVPMIFTSGYGDSFTPDATHFALMEASGLPVIDLVGELGDDAADFRIPEGISKVSGPIVGSNTTAAKGWVRVPRGSAPDGHFVAFSQEDAVRSVDRFLESLLSGNPVITVE